MSDSCVLITGAGGFAGRHLVRDQLDRGRDVRALDQNAGALHDLGTHNRLESIIADVADASALRRAVDGVDVVFHLASAHLEAGMAESEFHRVNVVAIETLLDASRRADVRRVVHVSSCGVHGPVARPPGNEQTPFRPDVAYERTKLAGELLAVELARRLGVSVVVARPAWIYGPECRRTARLFRTIARRRFVMVGRGDNRRAAIYISDFVDALERCAQVQGIDQEAFILVHDEDVTVRRIVGRIADLVGVRPPRARIPVWAARAMAAGMEVAARATHREPPVTRRSLKFFTNDAGFTCAKARRLLEFDPRVSLDVGLDLTHRWWRGIEDDS